ncbi:MAG: hypothetical protein Q3972_03170 [Corynebacterium sp.]|nr:hypothetical protein [Corynebacterium sp.]
MEITAWLNALPIPLVPVFLACLVLWILCLCAKLWEENRRTPAPIYLTWLTYRHKVLTFLILYAVIMTIWKHDKLAQIELSRVGGAPTILTAGLLPVLTTVLKLYWDRVANKTHWDDSLAQQIKALSSDKPLECISALNAIVSLSRQYESSAWQRLSHPKSINESVELYKQQCVDAICAFIKAVGNKDKAEAQPLQTAAINIIREQCKSEGKKPINHWSGCDFRLHQTTFHAPMHLTAVWISGKFILWDSVFWHPIYCRNSYLEDVDINGAKFLGSRIFIENTEFGKLFAQGTVIMISDIFCEETHAAELFIGPILTHPRPPKKAKEYINYDGKFFMRGTIDKPRRKFKECAKSKNFIDARGRAEIDRDVTKALEKLCANTYCDEYLDKLEHAFKGAP